MKKENISILYDIVKKAVMNFIEKKDEEEFIEKYPEELENKNGLFLLFYDNEENLISFVYNLNPNRPLYMTIKDMAVTGISKCIRISRDIEHKNMKFLIILVSNFKAVKKIEEIDYKKKGICVQYLEKNGALPSQILKVEKNLEGALKKTLNEAGLSNHDYKDENLLYFTFDCSDLILNEE
ncbi:MAG: AMMECR1 domain-containing protein [Candidatus Muiribacteriota bacterium]|jgi:AMMECR1 domain-containing protein